MWGEGGAYYVENIRMIIDTHAEVQLLENTKYYCSKV